MFPPQRHACRHLLRFRIERPTAVNICDTLGLRNPDRFWCVHAHYMRSVVCFPCCESATPRYILSVISHHHSYLIRACHTPLLLCRCSGLRGDGLAQLLAAANVRSGGRALVFDDTAGVVVGSVVERMGGRGVVIAPLPDKLTGPVWLHLNKFNLGHVLKGSSSDSSGSSSSSSSGSSSGSTSAAGGSSDSAVAPDAAGSSPAEAAGSSDSASAAPTAPASARPLRLVCVSYSQLTRWGSRVITPGSPAMEAAELEEVAAQEDAKIRRTFKAGSVPLGAGAAAAAAGGSSATASAGGAGPGAAAAAAKPSAAVSAISASAPAPSRSGSWKATAFAAKKRRMLEAHEATMAAKADASKPAAGSAAAKPDTADSADAAAATSSAITSSVVATMAEDADAADDATGTGSGSGSAAAAADKADDADADADADSDDGAGGNDADNADVDGNDAGDAGDSAADASEAAAGGAGAGSRPAAGSGAGAGSSKRRVRAAEAHSLSHSKLPPLEKRLLLQEGVSSILIVSEGHPAPLALAAVRFAAPSAPFAIFCRELHPLAETLRQLRALGVGANMTLSETFLRPQQVLPMRTHPEMVFHGASGYILRGTVPVHPYSAVLPPSHAAIAAAMRPAAAAGGK